MSLEDLIYVAPIVGILLSWFFWWKASTRTSDLGHQQHLRPWFLRGPEHYTVEGWRYRSLAITVALAAGLLSLLVAVLT